MIGSPDNISGRSEKLFVALGRAKPLKSSNLPGGDYAMGDIPRNFCLVEGRKTGHCHNKSQPSSLPKWLASVRTGRQQPVASFYFPDTLAGPDLLFALKRKVRSDSPQADVILCIVQVSTSHNFHCIRSEAHLFRQMLTRHPDIAEDRIFCKCPRSVQYH